MKFPWSSRKEKLEELEEEVDRLEDEVESWRNRFEAEEDRRKQLSREKQEAEKELNRLKDRIRSLEEGEEDEVSGEKNRFEEVEYERAKRILEKLGTFRGENIYTVHARDGLAGLDRQELKNSLTREDLIFVQDLESSVAFVDPDLFSLAFRTRPFFEPGFHAGEKFETGKLLEFMEEEKTWVLASLGDTKIFRETNGEYELLDEVKSRVDREHSKGGFSQGRFERKREEQVSEHAEAVNEELEDMENIYLLGNENLCSELPGEYLGGFDPNRKKPGAFYGFQLVRRDD